LKEIAIETSMAIGSFVVLDVWNCVNRTLTLIAEAGTVCQMSVVGRFHALVSTRVPKRLHAKRGTGAPWQ
jgi:hypothetical protein